MISALIPTRGRPEKLLESIRSLREFSTEPIEVVLRIDEDDTPTIQAAHGVPEPRIILIGPRHGYGRLQMYINECAAAAHGDWFLLWNDDSRIETEGWNLVVRAHDDGTLKILNPATNHNRPDLAIFPLIPRRMYEILGHFAFNNHNDTWVQLIGTYLDVLEPIDVSVFHDRWDLTGIEPDETAKQVEYRSGEFFSERNTKFIKRDADVLKDKWVDYNFEAQCEAWMSVPVDDIGYYNVSQLLEVSDDELNDLVQKMWKIRYDQNGWRNFQGEWVRYLNLDEGGRTILDFGCGIGLDGLRLARAGNEVILADVNEDSVKLAERVFGLYDLAPVDTAVIEGGWPYVHDRIRDEGIDEFYASGVLHHTPDAAHIIRRASELVGPTGIMRLMLYSEGAWNLYGQGDQETFIRAMDPVGHYADYYTPWTIEERFGKWADVLDVKYITDNLRYLVATLKAR